LVDLKEEITMSKRTRTVLFSIIIFALLVSACLPEDGPGSGTPGDGTPGNATLVPGAGTPGNPTLVPGAGTPGLSLPTFQIFIGTLPFLDIGTLPPSATPTPWFHGLILRDILCYIGGPGPLGWDVGGGLRKGTQVPVIGRGTTQGWLVILHLGYPCWVEEKDVDTGDQNPDDLPPVEPSARFTSTPTETEKPKDGCWLIGPKGERSCVDPCPADNDVPRGWTKGDACAP
jgi:hypothetical protein